MLSRDIEEEYRPSSPLELLFDVMFVAAISQLAAQLAHATVAGHAAEALLPFLMVFFAVWWAWMNFTWFASAYDCDDVAYRILTLLQMGGVLVVAAGVPAAFDGDFGAVTVGYLVMRVGLVALWLRAAASDSSQRRTATTYVVGISLVETLWLLRLVLPGGSTKTAFMVLVLLELLVPRVAELRGATTWHPHHIAERYGLFTIILLGETVLAATVAVQEASATALSWSLAITAVDALLLLFVVWWLYFEESPANWLERRREKSFTWGYGHFVLFASLAAMGAGFDVAVLSVGPLQGDLSISDRQVAAAVAVPVAVVLVMLWVLRTPFDGIARSWPGPNLFSALLVLVAAWLAPTVGVAASMSLITLAALGLLVVSTLNPQEAALERPRQDRAAEPDQSVG